MATIWNYTVAFFQVVVMGCIQPVNWEYCYRIDQWLIPDIQEGWKHYTGEIIPYQTEKEYLNKREE